MNKTETICILIFESLKTIFLRMKTKQIFSMVLTVLLLTSSMTFAQAKQGNDKVVFDVNMTCEACQKKIEKNIAFEKGVKAMEVNLQNKTVALTYDAKTTSPEKLQAALVKMGYTASASTGKKACSDVAAAGCKDKAVAGCKDKAGDKAGCCSKDAAAGCKDKAGCCSKDAAAGCKDKAGDKAGCCSKDKAAAGCKTDKAACCDSAKASSACKTDKGCTTAKTAETTKAGCCSDKKKV